jgi:hypothetical protein
MSAIVLSIKGSKLTQARTTLPPILTPAVRRLQKSSHKSGGFSAKAAQKEAIASLMQDSELRERCADLLSAPKHFDRPINQATLVLEVKWTPDFGPAA